MILRKQLQLQKDILDTNNLKLRLVSLFNGISTFMGYLKPKLFLSKNSSVTIQTIAGRMRWFIPFLKVLAQKWT